jgi:hypothetical protein
MKILPGKRTVIGLLAVAAVMLLPLAAQAELYNFFCINQTASPGPPPNDAYIAQNQLQLDVTSVDADTVAFKISNTGAINFLVSEIYFYDGSVLNTSVASAPDTPGVAFSQVIKDPMPDLPAGDDWGLPKKSAIFVANADNPAPTWGINPGEYLTINMDLLTGITFDDVIAALNMATYSNHFTAGETLVIGVHAISFPDGGSISLVDTNPSGGVTPPVPVPPTVWLLGSGLLGLGLMRWRRKTQ